MELTAGCSAGATDACLDGWRGMLRGQTVGEELAAAVQVELLCRKAQRADLEWPLDPPPRIAAHAYYIEACKAADARRDRALTHLLDLDNSRSATAGSLSSLSSLSVGDSVGLMRQRARLRELLLDRGLSDEAEAQGLRQDIALLQATLQAATAALPPEPSPPAFEYNARDRTLLQRFGLQREWLRYSLQAQLRRKYPVPDSVARQLMAAVSEASWAPCAVHAAGCLNLGLARQLPGVGGKPRPGTAHSATFSSFTLLVLLSTGCPPCRGVRCGSTARKSRGRLPVVVLPLRGPGRMRRPARQTRWAAGC